MGNKRLLHMNNSSTARRCFSRGMIISSITLPWKLLTSSDNGNVLLFKFAENSSYIQIMGKPRASHEFYHHFNFIEYTFLEKSLLFLSRDKLFQLHCTSLGNSLLTLTDYSLFTFDLYLRTYTSSSS